MFNRLVRALARRGAVLAYAALAVVFVALRVPPAFVRREGGTTSYEIGGLFAAIHNGGLLPLHGLLICGLCAEEDVVARAFLRKCVVRWGSISYEQYLYQTVVFKFLEDVFLAVSGGPDSTPYDGILWQLAAPVSITVVAFVIHDYVSVPAATYLRGRLAQASAVVHTAVVCSARDCLSGKEPLCSDDGGAATKLLLEPPGPSSPVSAYGATSSTAAEKEIPTTPREKLVVLTDVPAPGSFV